VFFFLIITI